MGFIIRCPLAGTSCPKQITVQEKTYFLAETAEPKDNRERRRAALNAVLEDNCIKSALDEKESAAFICKICEMIQTCSYGIADITGNNPNVLFELGMMIGLGKPTIILNKREQDLSLKLPSDLNAIEVIPFTDYIDIIKQLKMSVGKLLASPVISSPIESMNKLDPRIVDDLKIELEKVTKEFAENMKKARLDSSPAKEEKIEISPELNKRITGLEERLKDLSNLGLTTDAYTAFLRGNFYYNQDKYTEALESYNWSLELEPKSAAALINRGNAYHKLGKYEEALADYNLSLKLMPDNAGTLYNRGITYARLGRYDEAFTDFNLSLKLRPDNADTFYNMACTYSLMVRTSDAINYLKQAISKDKKYIDMAKTDKDFDNIRNDPRFQKLIE